MGQSDIDRQENKRVPEAALTRRCFSRHLLGLTALPLGLAVVFQGRALAAERSDPAPRPEPGTQRFLDEAFAMRRLAAESGDQAFGAVMVRENSIVARAPSRVVVNQDPTAHAEMEAIRAAALSLGTRDLSGCIMYSSSRPCPMCEAAAYWAGVDGLVYGPGAVAVGPPRLRGC